MWRVFLSVFMFLVFLVSRFYVFSFDSWHADVTPWSAPVLQFLRKEAAEPAYSIPSSKAIAWFELLTRWIDAAYDQIQEEIETWFLMGCGLCTSCRIEQNITQLSYLNKRVSNHWAFTCNCGRFGFNSVQLYFFNALPFDKLAQANSEPMEAMFFVNWQLPTKLQPHTHTLLHNLFHYNIHFSSWAPYALQYTSIYTFANRTAFAFLLRTSCILLLRHGGETEVLARVHHNQHQHLILIGWSSLFWNRLSMLQNTLNMLDMYSRCVVFLLHVFCVSLHILESCND